MKYLKFVKIEHTLFSLPVVFAGSFLALGGKAPSMIQAFWIILATLSGRAAGFGFNRVLDWELDAKNPRTQGREIPAGKISVKGAWVFTLASCGFFILSSLQLSVLCFYLSFIPLALFFIYPFLKRKTMWCHLGLGLAWGLAPLGGWLAVSPEIFPLSRLLPALLLSGFCAFWVAGFDVIYALLDEKFDRENGIFSLPAALGVTDALRVARLFHFVSLMFLGSMIEISSGRPLPLLLLALSGGLLALSHFRVENEPLSPPLVDFAFFKVNAALSFLVFFMAAC